MVEIYSTACQRFLARAEALAVFAENLPPRDASLAHYEAEITALCLEMARHVQELTLGYRALRTQMHEQQEQIAALDASRQEESRVWMCTPAFALCGHCGELLSIDNEEAC